MASSTPGAAILMKVPTRRFTKDYVRKAFDVLFGVENVDAGQLKAWRGDAAWADRTIALVHDHRGLVMLLAFWEPVRPHQMIGMTTGAQYCLDATNRLRLPEKDSVWLMAWLYEGNFKVTELDKAKRVAATFKTLAETLKPSFAAIDNFSENMAKRRGKDPRRFAWGAMYYDADHVQLIGEGPLRSCAALIKEEYPDGAMWVQTWGNPFIVAKELTQLMEKELQLKKLFGEAGAREPKPTTRA